MAVPALGTLVAEPLLGLCDTAFIGRVGAVELAALAAANALLSLLAASLIFLEYGTTARLARRHGAGDLAAVGREAVQTGWLATGLGLGLSMVLMVWSEDLLALVNAPREVAAAGAIYLAIRAPGMVAALWMRVGNGVFRGLQDTRTPFLIVLSMHVVNLVLDPILIFGWAPLGVPALGIAGAAWASLIATWIGGLAFVLVLTRRLRPALSGPRWYAPRFEVLRDLLGTSSDLLLRTLGLQAALFVGTRTAAGLGTAALAAHQIGWQLWALLALVLDSLAIAGQAMVGRALGQGRVEVARELAFRLCGWASWFGVGLALSFLLLKDVLPRIFSDDVAVLSSVASIFVILALMQAPNAVLFAIDGVLIGAADTRFLRNSMVALGLFGAGAAWLGGALTGDLRGVWLGISAFMLARLVVMGGRLRGRGWLEAQV